MKNKIKLIRQISLLNKHGVVLFPCCIVYVIYVARKLEYMGVRTMKAGTRLISGRYQYAMYDFSRVYIAVAHRALWDCSPRWLLIGNDGITQLICILELICVLDTHSYFPENKMAAAQQTNATTRLKWKHLNCESLPLQMNLLCQ